MRKIIILLLLLGTAMSCNQDTFEITEPISMVPESLEMVESVGVKLENIFVSDQVYINVKLPKDGTYRLKIRSIDGTLLSQEMLTAKEGNNLLSAYTATLENSSYTIELADINHNTLGTEIFVKQ